MRFSGKYEENGTIRRKKICGNVMRVSNPTVRCKEERVERGEYVRRKIKSVIFYRPTNSITFRG